jgi:energy-coupling factor transporter ATP-binding protein EcfA2
VTVILILIGDLGGGKSTLATLLSLIIRQTHPHVAQVTNVDIDTARKVEDTNKFIAIKLIKEDKRYAFCVEDEAAQAGLESRGSGSRGSALESRVITLARKAHVDLVLISQLMSMIDKRAQWLGNIYVLCEALFEDDNDTPFPDCFQYTVFDSKLKELGGFEVDFDDCVTYVFPHMDTDDIPYAEKLKEQWTQWYNITEKDYEQFDNIMEEKPMLSVIAR